MRIPGPEESGGFPPPPPMPAPPESQPNYIRRRILVAAGAGLVAIVGGGYGFGRLLTSGDGETPAPAPSGSPSPEVTQTTEAPTPDPTPTESFTPDEGAPAPVPEAVSALDALTNNTGSPVEGLTSYFTVGATPASREIGLGWQPAQLFAAGEHSYTAGVTFLDFGPGINANNPNPNMLKSYFQGMSDAGVDRSSWGRVVVPGSRANPANAVNVALTTAHAVREASPGTALSLSVDVTTSDKEFQHRMGTFTESQDAIKRAGFGSVTVLGFNSETPIPVTDSLLADVSGFLNPDRIAEASIATGLREAVHISTGIPRRDAHRVYDTDQRVAIAAGITDAVANLLQRGIPVAGVSLRADDATHDRTTGNSEGRGSDYSFPPGEEEAFRTLHDGLKALDPNMEISACAAPVRL